MKKKSIVFFIIIFVTSFLLVHLILDWVSTQQEKNYAQETEIIHENIQERFRIYMNPPLIIGLAAADILSKTNLADVDYRLLGSTIMQRCKEILGLNILDSQGKIIRVFPEKENLSALGKVSQNYPKFLASTRRGHSYWLSGPFQLFQGGIGFAFYIPIHKSGKIIGWIAPVMRMDEFFKNFQFSKFLKSYHLIIKDTETDLDYFATHTDPHNGEQLFHKEIEIYDRRMSFISWRKTQRDYFQIPWYLTSLISLFFACIFYYTYILFLEHKKMSSKLKEVNELLGYTVDEATRSLISIHRELLLIGKGTGYVSTDKVINHVSYTSNLIEQIKILKEITSAEKIKEFPVNDFLTLLKEQLRYYEDHILDKHLKVVFDPMVLEEVRVRCSPWLLGYGVIGNILRDSIMHSPDNGTVSITYDGDQNAHVINFHSSIIGEGDCWALAIAKEAVQVSGGEITFNAGKDTERIVGLKFPRSLD